MKTSFKYLFFFILLTSCSCTSIKPISKDAPKMIKGLIYDGESGDPMIALHLSEFNTPRNITRTNLKGEFELTFEGNIPVLVIHGSYAPLYVEITTDEVNIIYFDKLYRNSECVYKKATQLLSKEN